MPRCPPARIRPRCGSSCASSKLKLPASPANAVTLAQILTSTSGLVYDSDMQHTSLLMAPDPVLFVQGLPANPRTPPAWAYNNAAVSLLSPILGRALGMSMEEFARRELFSRLGVERFDWEQDRKSVV